jgi:hypothetical protein
MRRRFKTDSLHWHCRYVALPETSAKEVVVRKVIDALIYSTDMMSFVKSLGLRYMGLNFNLHYSQNIKNGVRVHCQWIPVHQRRSSGKTSPIIATLNGPSIQVLLYQVMCSDTIGNYNKLKQFGESFLIEASILVPDGQPYEAAMKTLVTV